jgi:hypothetical protein
MAMRHEVERDYGVLQAILHDREARITQLEVRVAKTLTLRD